MNKPRCIDADEKDKHTECDNCDWYNACDKGDDDCLCSQCNGSGEGQVDGSICDKCSGSGVKR